MDTGSASDVGSGVLDLVLALHRSPALRFQLREQPLPADIDLILRLAAPSQALLDETAARCGETPGHLREAARFYLLQVLLEPATDAYRILGVQADAPLERIREHHQWLQRWLHPDRVDDAAGVAFAARLNWAWQQLRNASKRAAYDRERVHPAPTVAVAVATAPARPLKWTTVPAPRATRPGRWWRRGALAAAFGSCIVLFVLALTRGGPVTTPSQDDTASAASHPGEAPFGLPVAPPAPTPRAPSPGEAPPRPDASPVAALPVRARAADPAAARLAVAQHPAPARLPIPPTLRMATPIERPQPPPIEVSTPTTRPPPALAPAHLAAVQPATATPQPAPASADPQALLHRVELARQRARLLVAYFRSAGNEVPDWRHAPAPYNAPLQRAALRERHGLPTAASFALDQPVWRMGGNHIAMDANYRVQRDQDIVERGRFRLRMVWLYDAWQITHLQLEPHG